MLSYQRCNQRQLAMRFGMSEAWVSQNIGRLMHESGFPRPIRGTERRPRWDAKAVDDWFAWREEGTSPSSGDVVALVRPGALRAAVAGGRR